MPILTLAVLQIFITSTLALAQAKPTTEAELAAYKRTDRGAAPRWNRLGLSGPRTYADVGCEWFRSCPGSKRNQALFQVVRSSKHLWADGKIQNARCHQARC